MERLKQHLEDTNKKTFLDIGTGAGNFIQLLKNIYTEYDKMVGIDLFEKGIEMANNQNDDDKISFEVMDAYHMTYPERTFDVISLSNSLHHLKDIPSMLLEMKRVLKDDGFIIINEMISNNLDAMQESHKMMHHFAAEVDRITGEIHNDTFTDDEIKTHLMNGTNLIIEDSWFLNVPRRTETSQEELDHILMILERVSSRIPDDMLPVMDPKKEMIKNYIKEFGYDGCPSLVTILKK